MEIRPDFVEVSTQLKRLLLYSQEAEKFDCHDWHHLKINEDYCNVYELDHSRRTACENIYSIGRELAGWLSTGLVRFNDVGRFPTLKSYLDFLDGTWVYQIDHLNDIIAEAQKYSQCDGTPWAIGRMIVLFQKEVSILTAIQNLIDQMKGSDLYQAESGNRKQRTEQEKVMNNSIIFNSPSNVQIGNQNIQSISQVFNTLVDEIEKSNASEDEKREAKSKLQAFFENPLVCSILGGVVGGVIGLK